MMPRPALFVLDLGKEQHFDGRAQRNHRERPTDFGFTIDVAVNANGFL